MIEYYFITMIYIGAFVGLAAIGSGVVAILDYICDRKARNKPIKDKPLSDSIRQIKIKPEYPEWISMVKNEFADEAEDKPAQRNVKIVM